MAAEIYEACQTKEPSKSLYTDRQSTGEFESPRGVIQSPHTLQSEDMHNPLGAHLGGGVIRSDRIRFVQDVLATGEESTFDRFGRDNH